MARKWRLFFRRIQSFLNLRNFLNFERPNFNSSSIFKFCRRKKIKNIVYYLLVFAIFFSIVGIFPVVAQSDYSKLDYSKLITRTPLTPNTLVQQGKFFYEQGNFPEAIRKLKEAKLIFKTRGDKLNLSMTLSNLSLAYQQVGEWENAENAITENINLLKSLTDYSKDNNSRNKLKLLANALEIKGKLQLSVGKPKQALSVWEDAANIFYQAGIQEGEIRSKINQSLALQELGRYREAYKILAGIIDVLPQQSELTQATAYRVISNAIRETGLVDEEGEKEKLLLLLLVKEHRKKIPSLFLRRPDNFMEFNYIEISRRFLQQSLNIYEKLPGKQPHSTQLKQEIAETYFSLGNTERAAYYRAKDAYERVKTRINDEDAQLKLITASIKYYEKSEKIATIPIAKVKSQLNQLSLLVDINKKSNNTIKHSIQTQYKEILNKKLLLKDNIDKLPQNKASIYATINLAQSLMDEYILQNNLFEENSDSQLIEELLNNAVEKSRRMGDERTESYALGNLAHLYENLGYLSKAQTITQDALQLADKSQAFDVAYQWQWQLGRILKKQGKYSGAIAAYKEAISGVKNLRQDLLGIYNPDIKFSFRDNIEPVYQELIELLLPYSKTATKQNKNDNDYSSILDKGNLKDAIQVVENLQVLELETFMRCNLQNSVGVSVDEIINEQDDKAAIIYPIILEDRIEVLLKLPKRKSILRFTTEVSNHKEVEPTLKELEKLIRNKNQNNDKNDSTFKSESSKLYQWLFKQQNNSLEDELNKNKIETLVFVLGSYSTALRNIPIAALYDAKNKQYLIQKGYSVALNLGSELIKTKALNKGKFNILAAGVSKENPVPEVRNKPFEALPSVFKELNDIEYDETFKSKKILRDEEFTPEALRKFINLKSFGVLHLATHGQFSSSPDNTFILAYGKHMDVNQLGNLLHSRQEKRTEPIELLVLSACETANGDKRASLGIAGVSVKVGARSIVASLFKVKDASTYELMKSFYEKLGEVGVTRAQALSYAQNELLSKGDPVYDWAPFILVGNWH